MILELFIVHGHVQSFVSSEPSLVALADQMEECKLLIKQTSIWHKCGHVDWSMLLVTEDRQKFVFSFVCFFDKISPILIYSLVDV